MSNDGDISVVNQELRKLLRSQGAVTIAATFLCLRVLPKAIATVESILDDDTARDADRLKAAELVHDWALASPRGVGDIPAQSAPRDAGDLSPDELEALISDLRGLRDARAAVVGADRAAPVGSALISQDIRRTRDPVLAQSDAPAADPAPAAVQSAPVAAPTAPPPVLPDLD